MKFRIYTPTKQWKLWNQWKTTPFAWNSLVLRFHFNVNEFFSCNFFFCFDVYSGGKSSAKCNKNFESNINFPQHVMKKKTRQEKTRSVKETMLKRIFASWIWEDVYWSRRFNISAIMVIVIENTAIPNNTNDVEHLRCK